MPHTTRLLTTARRTRTHTELQVTYGGLIRPRKTLKERKHQRKHVHAVFEWQPSGDSPRKKAPDEIDIGAQASLPQPQRGPTLKSSSPSTVVRKSSRCSRSCSARRSLGPVHRGQPRSSPERSLHSTAFVAIDSAKSE